MVNSNFSIFPTKDNRTEQNERTKPNTAPPSGDRFRKSMKEREEKRESELVPEEEAPSLFELSKSKGKGGKPVPTSKKASSEKGGLSSLSKTKQEGSENISENETPSYDEDKYIVDEEPSSYEESSLPGESEESYSEEKDFSEVMVPNASVGDEENKFQSTNAEKFGQKPVPELSEKNEWVAPTPKVKEPIKPPLEATKNVQITNKIQTQPQESKTTSDKPSKVSSKKENQEEKKTSTSSERKEVEGSVFAPTPAMSFHAETSGKPDVVSQTSRKEIADLVSELVKRIEVMQKGNETHTTITLSHPPAFKDATITLTNTESAKREFNISFANLSSQGKILLDQALRDNSLVDRMKEKNLIIHVVTTSTEPQTLFTAEAPSDSSRERGGQQQQQQQREDQQRNEKDNQNEEET